MTVLTAAISMGYDDLVLESDDMSVSRRLLYYYFFFGFRL